MDGKEKKVVFEMKWEHRFRQPSPVRRIDPASGQVIGIIRPASGKPKRRRRRPMWRYDDVALGVLDELKRDHR
jgi:hypothetical protein